MPIAPSSLHLLTLSVGSWAKGSLSEQKSRIPPQKLHRAGFPALVRPALSFVYQIDPDSCLQSMPECGGKGTEGLPSCGIRNEETGTKSAVAAAQESPSSGDRVLQGDVVHPGTAQCFSAGEPAVSSTADASVPETAGERERGLMNPDATVQKNVLEGGESTKEGLENSPISTAGASDVRVTSKPVDKASVANCVSATGSLDGNKPAESLFAFSNGETSTEKTAETEASRSCEESADDRSFVSKEFKVNRSLNKDFSTKYQRSQNCNMRTMKPE